jgi:sec-independent protein translocase protein TatA
MFRALEPWHLIILVLVVVLLFGGKRLPDAARGLGRSLRIFKSEVKQMHDETPRPAARPSEPIEGPYEGRVVDEPRRAATPGEPPRDL